MGPNLLTIPREVRDQILEYCLLVDGEIVPYPTWYELEDGDVKKPRLLPCTALLGVCESMRVEAAEILFGKNVWRISDLTDSLDELKAPAAWEDFWGLIRHATITIDCRACNPTEMLAITKNLFGDKYWINPQEIHSERKDHFNKHWEVLVIAALAPQIETLRIDFTNSYCPSGCCRLVEHIAFRLQGMLEEQSKSFRLTAVGLLNETELCFMHEIPSFRCKDCFVLEDSPDTRHCSTYKENPLYPSRSDH